MSKSSSTDGHSTRVKGIAALAVSFLLCVLTILCTTSQAAAEPPDDPHLSTQALSAVHVRLDTGLSAVPALPPRPATAPASPALAPKPAPARPKPVQMVRPQPQRPTYAVRQAPRPARSAPRTELPRRTAPVRTFAAVNQMPKGSIQTFARSLVTDNSQFTCLAHIIDRESGWNTYAQNPSGAYGIPQALPGAKMSSAGSDWRTNPKTQLRWMMSYISSRYGTPCNAWGFWQGHSWY